MLFRSGLTPETPTLVLEPVPEPEPLLIAPVQRTLIVEVGHLLPDPDRKRDQGEGDQFDGGA